MNVSWIRRWAPPVVAAVLAGALGVAWAANTPYAGAPQQHGAPDVGNWAWEQGSVLPRASQVAWWAKSHWTTPNQVNLDHLQAQHNRDGPRFEIEMYKPGGPAGLFSSKCDQFNIRTVNVPTNLQRAQGRWQHYRVNIFSKCGRSGVREYAEVVLDDTRWIAATPPGSNFGYALAVWAEKVFPFPPEEDLEANLSFSSHNNCWGHCLNTEEVWLGKVVVCNWWPRDDWNARRTEPAGLITQLGRCP